MFDTTLSELLHSAISGCIDNTYTNAMIRISSNMPGNALNLLSGSRGVRGALSCVSLNLTFTEKSGITRMVSSNLNLKPRISLLSIFNELLLCDIVILPFCCIEAAPKEDDITFITI